MAAAKTSRTPPAPRRIREVCVVRSSSYNGIDLLVRGEDKAARYCMCPGVAGGRLLLGQGKFGKVYRALDTKNDDHPVAVKVLNANCYAPLAPREIATMRRLSHPHIAKMLDSYVQKHLHIVYELIAHGELFHWLIHKYDEAADERPAISDITSERIARQVAHAVNYCHGKGVAHRDIKPENVLIEQLEPDIRIKVVDFGLSYVVKTGMSHYTDEVVGSPDYAAPEILFAGPKREIDPFLADVWSYGVLLYIMHHFYFPWSVKRVCDRWRRGYKLETELTCEVEPHVCASARRSIVASLRVRPEARESMATLLAIDWLGDDDNGSSSPSSSVVYHGSDREDV